MTFGGSVLVLGGHVSRRLAAADAFRDECAVVVEAATIQQADSILRQLRFDVIAVDLYGLEVGAVQLVHDLGVDYPSTCIWAIGHPVDSNVSARLHRSHAVLWPTHCNEGRLTTVIAQHYREGGSDSSDRLGRNRGAGKKDRKDTREEK